MDQTANPNPAPGQEPKAGEDPVAALRAELEAIKAESVERVARLERELQAAKQAASASPQYPTTAEGWAYALQVAQLRATQDENLRPHLASLYSVYNEWARKEQALEAERHRALGRVDAELSRLGVSPDSRQSRIVKQAVAAGVPYEDLEATFLKLIKDTKVKEAEGRAVEAQGTAAKRGVIEGGQMRGRLPDDAAGPKVDPNAGIMQSLQALYRERAPSSVKFARTKANPGVAPTAK